MTKPSTTKSLIRTASNGDLNVFLVLEVKATKELLILSREELPPALRLGKLTLKQKVTCRDQNRQNVESIIVFIHPERQVCVNAKQQMMQPSKQSNDSVSEDRSIDTQKSSLLEKSVSKPANGNGQSGKLLSTTSTNAANKKTIKEKESLTATSNPLPILTQSPSDNLIDRETFASNLDDNVECFSNPVEDDNEESDCLLKEIQKLTLKVKQQSEIIKERDIEIKRLKSTTINMPTDENARDYIAYLSNRIKLSTNGFKYSGNLTIDAKRLGIKFDELKQCLDAQRPISTTARMLFKKIVPALDRQVDHWNKLSSDVLMKEKILLNFLERYFGPIEVDQKKLHTSLVSCLRNQRGFEKKQKQQSFISNESIDYDFDEAD